MRCLRLHRALYRAPRGGDLQQLLLVRQLHARWWGEDEKEEKEEEEQPLLRPSWNAGFRRPRRARGAAPAPAASGPPCCCTSCRWASGWPEGCTTRFGHCAGWGAATAASSRRLLRAR
ncbi:unnamed protein product [Prorocentrum cordatum]|uniref:Uncharacterized protein n=1 Tax=Prorocentrum cordatum TaxID=2364126 RepID=A0ABN9UQE2_9DINO|nr:unnamed protein product [Polarella glacialis]